MIVAQGNILMKKIFLLIFFSILQYSYAQVTVVEDSLYSSSLFSTMKCYVVLPDGYSKTEERYTSIYLLHGFNGDYTNWIKQSDLIRYAKKYNYLFISIDARNSWYTNSTAFPSAKYEDYVIKDILPFIDTKYRTIQSKFNRAIIGFSMGGYGATKFAIKYPAKFFFAGCLSPSIAFPFGLEDSAIIARRSKESNLSVRNAFGAKRNNEWYNNDVFILADKIDPKIAPFFYLAFGSQDGIPEIIDLTPKFADVLRRRGIEFELHETAGAHDWKFWDREFEIVLHRLLEKLGKK